MNEPEFREVSAYREAGHAVFANMFNISLRFVTIDEPARFQCEFIASCKMMLFNRVAGRIMFKSGLMVQRKYFPEVIDPRDGKTDQKHIDTLDRWSSNAKDEELFAEEFIYRHLKDPKVLDEIEKIAHALLVNSTLTGKEVSNLLDEGHLSMVK